MIIGFTVYFSLFEAFQFRQGKISYLKKVWNYLDVSTYVLNLAYVIVVTSQADPLSVRPLGAIIILLMWTKLLYFLRLFLPTLYMISMIIQVFYDMYTFVIVMALAMVAFGNALYVISISTLEV
mmetsp:Transcript_24245/g.23840  ORF Transcript_24245/g.23840 Transcript_24245/m.23840 type:complete len:124 (+) Transcript_24245:1049-1420(+)